jgi:acyl CoA:acetate/3-ketoacid CoA transferase beta subunit
MPHCDKDGNPKLVEQCDLPLTARRCVSTVITEYAVFDIDARGLSLREMLGDLSLAQLQAMTAAPIRDARL